MLKIKDISQQTWVKFFTHLIVIVMIFFLPELMWSYGKGYRTNSMEMVMYFKAAYFVFVFYINYYLIINRTLFGKKQVYLSFILWNLLLILVFIAIFYLYRNNIFPQATFDGRGRHHKHEIPHTVMLIRNWSWVLRDVGMIVLTVALSTALRFAERWSAMEKRHEQLLASQKTEELQNLKSQLNPHFLFNTLNTIYSLVDISPKEAQDAIHQLSKLLRYVLYENTSLQPLVHEIDFIKTYISLMEMRLGDGVVRADFSHIEDQDIKVAPMLFITIVENAFKYGNTGAKDPIEVSVSSTADGTVTCRTHNRFVPGRHDDKRGGIGLANLRRRLLLIYGDNARLTTTIDGDTYTALLTIHTEE